jgi:hypothetical protein
MHLKQMNLKSEVDGNEGDQEAPRVAHFEIGGGFADTRQDFSSCKITSFPIRLLNGGTLNMLTVIEVRSAVVPHVIAIDIRRPFEPSCSGHTSEGRLADYRRCFSPTSISWSSLDLFGSAEPSER